MEPFPKNLRLFTGYVLFLSASKIRKNNMESCLFQSYVSAKEKDRCWWFSRGKMFSKMLGNVGIAFRCFLDGEDSWLLFRSFSGQNIQQDETKFEPNPQFSTWKVKWFQSTNHEFAGKKQIKTVPYHLRLMMIIILFIDNNNNNNRSSK